MATKGQTEIKKIFDFLEMPNAAHYKKLVMSNINGDFNIASASLTGFG